MGASKSNSHHIESQFNTPAAISHTTTQHSKEENTEKAIHFLGDFASFLFLFKSPPLLSLTADDYQKKTNSGLKEPEDHFFSNLG